MLQLAENIVNNCQQRQVILENMQKIIDDGDSRTYNFWRELKNLRGIDITTFHLNDYTEAQDPYWEFSTCEYEFCIRDEGYTKEQALYVLEEQFNDWLWHNWIDAKNA